MIAIHNDNVGFHARWVQYCEEQAIPYKRVDCYSSRLISDLGECKALMWHHNHAYAADQLVAKQILFALQHAGIVVFPDFRTAWHFDDKVAQKYLLEALGIRAVNSYVFVSEGEAQRWVRETSFPKVFKLRRGAGSKNVRLVKDRRSAMRLIKKAFRRGFRPIDAYGEVAESWRKFKIGRASVKELLKAVAHLTYPYSVEKALGREKGYVYFQDFLPDNTFDIRVIVIGDKAFAIKRSVRPNDFRASGSGLIEYDKSNFDDQLIGLAFQYAALLGSSCVAFDFIFEKGTPYVVEISYGFAAKGYDPCPGYWTSDLSWHEGPFNPYGWMVQGVLDRISGD